MDFSLSMEQNILRESVRAFAEKEIKPAGTATGRNRGILLRVDQGYG